MTEQEIHQRFDLQYPVNFILPQELPWYFRVCLTIDEAAEYSGIGQARMRQFAYEHEEIVLYNGTKMLIKRKMLEDALIKAFTI